IRGYKVRLPLDLFVVASANPEDYTNRGRIITPLKDRFGSQIRTHYPKELAIELTIMEQERTKFASEELTVTVPTYMKEILGVFNRTFSLAEFDTLLAAFQKGATMSVSADLASKEYVAQALQIPGMKGAVAKLGAQGNPAAIAAAVEFVLEGLHLNRKLNKE